MYTFGNIQTLFITISTAQNKLNDDIVSFIYILTLN